MSYQFTLVASPKGTEDIDALTGVRRDQFLTAAKKEFDGDCKAPSDYFKNLAAELNEEADDQYVELWAITKEGKEKAVYEMWYFPVSENGAIFGAGTAKAAGVEMLEGIFEARDGGAKQEALAEALQDPFDDRETEDDDDEEDDDEEDEDEDEDEDDDDDDDDDDEEDDEEDED
jgi:hypothetical protein